MKKLLVICGPTATGKTTVAIKLAKRLRGEIVSADSRQVYKGMDIGTGKDLPRGAKLKGGGFGKAGYYKISGIPVWGYDLVKPTREFSVAQYTKRARGVISNIWKRGKLPILVGGTGLYIKGVVDGIETSIVPKNRALRKILKRETTHQLFERLAQLAPTRAAIMNTSDKKNPRRLVRAIEIAEWQTRKGKRFFKKNAFEQDVLFVGLYTLPKGLTLRIRKRVKKRLEQGFEDEVKTLMKKLRKNSQAWTSLGYRQWRDYLGGKISKNRAIDKWIREESKYAKRQMAWFKKDKRIIWFDVRKTGFPGQVEKVIRRWYSSSDA